VTEQIKIAELMARSGVGFGTSGARGRVADMSAPVCYAYTLAFLQHLADKHALQAGSAVALAGDLRPSTPAIMSACAAAIEAAGHRPVNCGFVPSPAVALYGLARGIPSLMVTGSHIPDDRNGIKFNTAAGEILKDDEAGIRAQVVTIPERIPGDALPAEDKTARDLYLQRYVEFFGATALAGMRVAVYEHSGVARDLLGELLAALGAGVIHLGRSDTFMPVDTEAIRSEDIELARAWARDPGFDAIVSTDGDADRPLIGTEAGEWLRGDVVGVLCAEALGIEALATPVSSNTVVEACGHFAAVERTRIGSPYVIAGMQALQAAGHARVAGYEANGGFLLATDLERQGRHLAALPTRDAVLPILTLLVHCRENSVQLSALPAGLPQRFTASDRLKDYPMEKSQALLAELQAGGEPAMSRMFGGLCGPLASVNLTDGLRMCFINGEVVHIRPSGNAPELRCYNEAASESRVIELNQTIMQLLAALAK
jgi:phosphomannomutase